METKICSKCGIEKPIECFRLKKDKRHTKGFYFYSYCKECEYNMQKHYNNQNIEIIKKYRKEYKKNYDIANKDKNIEYRKKYYQKHKDNECFKEKKKKQYNEWYQNYKIMPLY